MDKSIINTLRKDIWNCKDEKATEAIRKKETHNNKIYI